MSVATAIKVIDMRCPTLLDVHVDLNTGEIFFYGAYPRSKRISLGFIENEILPRLIKKAEKQYEYQEKEGY